MFRERYKRLNDQIYPDEKLIDKVLQGTEQNQVRKREQELSHVPEGKRDQELSHVPEGKRDQEPGQELGEKREQDWHRKQSGTSGKKLYGWRSDKGWRRARNRKTIIAVVLLLMCIFTAVPVLAANVPTVYELMYLVSPTVAQFFMPVQQSCESNGIKMEVVSAYIHGDTAEVYVTLQDLTGDRVDASTDLNDSYSINRPFDSAAGCRQVGYDEKTKTATFLISITQWGQKKISGNKITFSVREFISHKQYYNELEIPLNMAAVEKTPEVRQVQSTGGGGEEYQTYIDQEGALSALKPGEPIVALPTDGIQMTAAGYVDGKLHLQIAMEDRQKKDNHGYFYLKNSEEIEAECGYNFYFTNGKDGRERVDYCEFVFDMEPTELSDMQLYGSFVTGGMNTSGQWRVTFPLTDL